MGEVFLLTFPFIEQADSHAIPHRKLNENELAICRQLSRGSLERRDG